MEIDYTLNYNTFMKKKIYIFLLAVGVWIIVSPFVLGFSGLSLALWGNVFSGVAVVLAILWVWLEEEEK